MNWQSWLIFMLITNSFSGVCQLSEDFSTGNGWTNQPWSGNTALFTVSNGQLQLMGDTSGIASILHPITVTDPWEWTLFWMMDFAPSDQNKLILFLWLSEPNANMADALFVSIGENGANDAIELYQRKNGTLTLLGTGEAGQVSGSPAQARLKIILQNGLLELATDYNGGIQFDTELLVPFESFLPDSAYFGWQCIYTATRRDKFFFDDIYAGSLRLDTSPPVLIEAIASDSLLLLTFSEALGDSVSLKNFTLLNSNIQPTEYFTDASGSVISLVFQDFLEKQKNYELQLSDVSDKAGNSLDTTINFLLASEPQIGDLLINEILFNPIGSGADYVEIINTTGQWLNLSGIKISNMDRNETEPVNREMIQPFGLLCLTDNKANILATYPYHGISEIYEQAIPAFNNNNGNVSILYNGQILDQYNYDEDDHNPFLDNVDGVSLERISVDSPSSDKQNWSSALSGRHYGTPGLTNSLSAGIHNEDYNIHLSSRSFSPDGDGYHDLLDISYTIGGPSRLATVKIFNDGGSLIKELVDNELVGGRGNWYWDGHQDDGQLAQTGIYVVWIQLFSASGTVQNTKLTAVLAKRIN